MEAGARLERLHALAAWLEAQPGAKAASDLLELVDCGALGFGFRAKCDIPQGGVLCSVPVHLAWSALAARASPTLGPLLQRCSGLRVDDLIALHLMHERARREASPRWPHLASLPEQYDATLFWTDDELAELQGSPLAAQTHQLLAQTEADYAELHAALLAPNAELFLPAACSLTTYRWALATIWSRAMDLPDGDTGSLRVVTPWADMFNNDCSLPVCHAHERTGNAVVALAGRAYAAGEAVCITYGFTDAASALRLHGFVPAAAPTKVPLYAEMAPEADLYDAKRRLLDAAGVLPGTPFTLTLEQPLPPSLLLALRVQRASAPELAAAERDGLQPGARLSEENERAVLGALGAGLEAMLEGYATSVEEDEAMLASADAAALSNRRRGAVELRLREKRVLLAAQAAVSGRLSALGGDDAEDAPPPSLEQAAAAAMASGTAPAAAAELAAYFESLLAEGIAEGADSAGALDSLD